MGCSEFEREEKPTAMPGLGNLCLFILLSPFPAFPPESEHIVMHFALFYCIDFKVTRRFCRDRYLFFTLRELSVLKQQGLCEIQGLFIPEGTLSVSQKVGHNKYM